MLPLLTYRRAHYSVCEPGCQQTRLSTKRSYTFLTLPTRVRQTCWLRGYRTLEHPELGPGSIIDLHDSAETEDAGLRLQCPLATIAALPRIIEGLKARGLRCVRLDEMDLVEPEEWVGP